MSSARRKQTVAFGCLLLLAVLASLAIRSNQLEAQVSKQSLNGTYELQATTRAKNEVSNSAAIQEATRELEPSLARQWRGTLEIMAMPQKRIQIANTNEEIAVATGGRPATKSPASGAVRQETQSLTVSQRFEGAALVKRITSATLAGKELETPLQQTTRYSLASDGTTLSVETTVTGGMLVEPLVLHMTYERVEQLGAPRRQ